MAATITMAASYTTSGGTTYLRPKPLGLRGVPVIGDRLSADTSDLLNHSLYRLGVDH